MESKIYRSQFVKHLKTQRNGANIQSTTIRKWFDPFWLLMLKEFDPFWHAKYGLLVFQFLVTVDWTVGPLRFVSKSFATRRNNSNRLLRHQNLEFKNTWIPLYIHDIWAKSQTLKRRNNTNRPLRHHNLEFKNMIISSLYIHMMFEHTIISIYSWCLSKVTNLDASK